MFKTHQSLQLMIGCACSLMIALYFTLPITAHAQTTMEDGPVGWLPTATLAQGLADPSVVATDSAIHIIGGQSPAGPTDSHIQLDPMTKQLVTLPALPIARSDATTILFDDTIYVFGGYNMWYGGAISYTHGYQVTTQRWITATAMLTPVSGAAGTIIDKEIYIFGGFDNISETSLVQSYQPATDTWTMRTPMPTARSEFSVVALDGLVYLIGGNVFQVGAEGTQVLTNAVTIPSTLVSVYNPTTDVWSQRASLPEPRVDGSATVLNGKIYVSGGTDRWLTGNVQPTLFIYDPESDSWRNEAPLPAARGGHRSTVANGKLYVIGGYDAAGFLMASVDRLDRIAETIYLPLLSR